MLIWFGYFDLHIENQMRPLCAFLCLNEQINKQNKNKQAKTQINNKQTTASFLTELKVLTQNQL